MKQWKYFDDGLQITLYHYCQKNLEESFTIEGTPVACKDVDGLFKTLNMSHCSDEWKLFIDAFKVSLKAVLLQNGNVLPSIPVAHAFGKKESDDSMKQLLQYVKYDTYKWNICVDLKVTALLLGLQLGYTKFCCFLRGGQQKQGPSLCQKDMACQKDFGARTQKRKASFIHWLNHRGFCCHPFIPN